MENEKSGSIFSPVAMMIVFKICRGKNYMIFFATRCKNFVHIECQIENNQDSEGVYFTGLKC